MIGGNTTVIIEHYDVTVTHVQTGEKIPVWKTLMTLTGWLDLMSGEAKYTYNAKLQESTHIFLCDHVELDKHVTNKRMVIDGDIYDILLIDDPMQMHQHLEIYLRYVGR